LICFGCGYKLQVHVQTEKTMVISRRRLVTSMLASGLLTGREALAAPAEPFAVKLSETKEVEYKFRRRELDYDSQEPAGTIVVDPRKCFLFYILGNGKALRYGVAVGKSAMAWSGEVVVQRMAEWPVWVPTPYHIAAIPALAKHVNGMPGGPDNPMGARAMYLYKGEVDTVNRIHGAAKPSEIGRKATAGCIGMLNVDVIDLYARVQLGTRVVMLG
jgi:lipoprotein-anchoring transpeptidase ErfK/SrfK